MLFLSESQVRQCLSMKDCLEVNRLALSALATGQAEVPTRLAMRYEPPTLFQKSTAESQHKSVSSKQAEDWTLFKPATYNPFAGKNSESMSIDDHGHPHDHNHHHDHSHSHQHSNHYTTPTPPVSTVDSLSSPDILMGLKVVSVRADNPRRQLPLVPATIVTIDAESGRVEAVVSATYLTAARTAAGSALATLLCAARADHMVVFGAGLQAELHIEAIATALPHRLAKITIVNRSLERACRLKDSVLGSGHADECSVVSLQDTLNVSQAISTATIIVAATNTCTPLFHNGSVLLPSGCHINGVGSYTPDMQEISAKFVSDRCRVMMDTKEARAVGDLAGLSQTHPVQLVGTFLQHNISNDNWTSSRNHYQTWINETTNKFPNLDCSIYKAVGTAIQDVMVASHVVQRAKEMGIGTQIDMDN